MRPLLICLAVVLSTGCVTTRIRPPKVEGGPPGSVPVEVVSGNTGRNWDVFVGSEKVCTSPCNGFVERGRSIMLRSAGDTIRLVNGVDEYRGIGPLRLRAVGRDSGAFAGGVTFTSLGGMALITGGALGLAGAASEREGLAMAGGITAGAGAAVLLGGLIILFNSFPHAEFYAFDGEQPVRLIFGPDLIRAEF